MRIQHNIAALNSYRQLSGNNNALSKNLEKLSSGYRINRAGDDAAGLAISEKMRAQIKGLEAAQKNANDGISLVQTAEGALTEVHSMLNRMVYLATQSSNGTYDDTTSRAALQDEITSLLDEIDRISQATNFNGINLLDGSLGGAQVKATNGVKTVAASGGSTGTDTDFALQGGTISVSSPTNGDDGASGGTAANAAFSVDLSGVSVDERTDTSEALTTNGKLTIAIGSKSMDIDITGAKTNADIITAVKNALGSSVEIEDGTNAAQTFNVTESGGTFTFNSTTQATFDATNLTVSATLAQGKTGESAGSGAVAGSAASTELNFDGRVGADVIGSTLTINGTKYEYVKTGGTATDTSATAITVNEDDDASALATATATAIGATISVANGTSGNVTFDVAANAEKVTITEQATGAGNDEYSGINAPTAKIEGGGLTLQVGDTNDTFQKVRVGIDDMSASALKISTIDISTQPGASDAIAKIKDAINTVSSQRGALGAVQNRLEHTINNLGVTTENLTAAESRIRDTDMAEEMMAYTKNNILVQAAQAMLAQANTVPQGVLQLLQ